MSRSDAHPRAASPDVLVEVFVVKTTPLAVLCTDVDGTFTDLWIPRSVIDEGTEVEVCVDVSQELSVRGWWMLDKGFNT